MAGTPESFADLDLLLNQTVEDIKPTETYGFDWEQRRIFGKIDGKDASWQAFRKILSTSKYETPIYDWRYGHELENVLGQPKALAKSETERHIREAVSQDDRYVSLDTIEWVEEGVDFGVCRVTINTVTMPYIFDLEVPW